MSDAEANFNAGRDLAVNFLRAARRDAVRYGDVECDGNLLIGGAFRRAFEALRQSPQLLDGFDAVLCEYACITAHGTVEVGALEEGVTYEDFVDSENLRRCIDSGKVAMLNPRRRAAT
jgi:hypothetical protein